MKRLPIGAAVLLAFVGALASALWAFPNQSPAAAARIRLTAVARALVDQGLAGPAPDDPKAAGFEAVPSPGVRYLPNVARATNLPWIDSNGWRFARGIRKAHYAKIPAGSAALAAAEASMFDVEAVLDPDAKDLDDLARILKFLRTQERPALPPLVNIAVVDSASPAMTEVLNLLTRRNLLYRVVRAPDPSADLTVQIGTPDFPADSVVNPYEFAARVRAKLGDDKRLVRIYGTSTVLARLTGDRTRARLQLLSFGRRQQGGGDQSMRVRVLGRYRPAGFAAYGTAAEAQLSDVRHADNGTEFWVPDFTTYAVIDLEPVK